MSIVDSTSTENPGHVTFNGRVDLLHSAIDELCVELNRIVDGYRGV